MRYTDCPLFTETELEFLVAVLRFAQTELLEIAKGQHDRFPTSGVVETYRQWAELVCDLRERIERR